MKLRLFPITVTALLSCVAVPAAAQDFFCFMESTSGQVIDLTGLCAGGTAPSLSSGTPAQGAAPATGFEPVIGGNDLIPAVLELQRDGAVWVVSGFVGNRGPVGINIMAVQFDLLDEAGQVIYQGSITPIPDLSRVQAGSQRRVSTRVPANQVSGTPISVVPVEVRYVR